jgi:hypothetical protein
LKATNDFICRSLQNDWDQGDIARHGKLNNVPPGFPFTWCIIAQSIRHHEQFGWRAFL